jgi:hypothetical protein
MLIVNYQDICLTTFPAAPPLPDSDGNDYNNQEDDDHEDNPQEASLMSKAATKTAAAATTAKKTATAKMAGKTEANYLSIAPSVHQVLKSYGLGTNNKFAVSYDTKGTTDFVLFSFYVNGALPKKGRYLATLLEDGYTLSWSSPIDSFLFMMEHLCSIMGSKYSESNVQVCLFNEITQQALYKDTIKPDTNGNYWGKPQKVHLKKKCTGTP